MRLVRHFAQQANSVSSQGAWIFYSEKWRKAAALEGKGNLPVGEGGGLVFEKYISNYFGCCLYLHTWKRVMEQIF